MIPAKASPATPPRTIPMGGIPCPGKQCRGTMTMAANATLHCSICHLQVNGETFNPVAPVIHGPELAMDQDATCVYHPHKRAVQVCQGTGNFICALCAVEIKGKSYSVQYLESQAGKEKVAEIGTPFLRRPDRAVRNIFVALVLPYSDVIVFASFPLWAVYGYVKCRQMAKLRRENSIYHDVVGKWHIAINAILLSLLLAGWLALLIALVAYRYVHR